MKQIHKSVPLSKDPYLRHYFLKNHVFFDIETTGFSPKTAFVYLIGMAFLEENAIQIYQFLAQNRKEEAEILAAFHKHLKPHGTLVTFHGLGFDIPFLKSREQLYSMPDNWNSYDTMDLYKIMGKYSHLFQLPNKKQKSFERFLGIDRDDLFSGGELIDVYYAYEKQSDPQSENLLLLHNYEDVLGMTKLLPLLSYADFFEMPKKVTHASLKKSLPYESTLEETCLLLTLDVPMPFPKHFLYQTKLCNLMCENTSAKLLVPVFSGELKFYYENYKDYYYLPDEDMAIHKSVASFIDSRHRKKATAATCYTKKSGTFLPQAKNLFTPAFSFEKKALFSYFEITDDFLSNQSALNKYAAHLLEICLLRKK